MEETVKTFPQHTCSWVKGKLTLCKYQGYWNVQILHEAAILAQQTYKQPQPSDVFICSFPKTGTTWLKALAFAIVTRQKFDESTSPLLTTMPHDCIPFLEQDLEQIIEKKSSLVATHLPYNSLPESIVASNCKIVYIYRNIKDVIVSYYHFLREANKLSMEDAPFEEAFEEFCEGISWCGPFWDHILGYWKARLERPEEILFLKYEDMKREPVSNVKRLAEFIGYPFTDEEEKAGVIESVIKLCSFENLSNLEVNKSGKHREEESYGGVENRIYFRKAKEGDWENYFTEEMNEKIDKLIDEKLGVTDLALK